MRCCWALVAVAAVAAAGTAPSELPTYRIVSVGQGQRLNISWTDNPRAVANELCARLSLSGEACRRAPAVVAQTVDELRRPLLVESFAERILALATRRRVAAVPAVPPAGAPQPQPTTAWVIPLTTDSFVPGAVALAHSIRRTETAHPEICAMVTPGVSAAARERLRRHGLRVRAVEEVSNPNRWVAARWASTYSLLRVWTLVEYRKVVLIQPDFLVLQNADELFDAPSVSATEDPGLPLYLSSALLVLEPSMAFFDHLADQARTADSFDGGDLGFLNAVLDGEWHILHPRYHATGFLLHDAARERTEEILAQTPHWMVAIEFMSTPKPWDCADGTMCATAMPQVQHREGLRRLWWRIYDEAVVEEK